MADGCSKRSYRWPASGRWFCTITSDRSYKKGRPANEALSELERCANTQFDPQLIAAFVRAMRQLPNPIIEAASLLSRNS